MIENTLNGILVNPLVDPWQTQRESPPSQDRDQPVIQATDNGPQVSLTATVKERSANG